ncbi:MAG: penicillin-binding protein 1A [Proteobacteria bacterium]|nr:penicillin-binding protein 1A [Pseudomonadota bacterium]
MLKFLGWLFAAGFMIALGLTGASLYIMWDVSKDLPDYKQLAAYEPPVMTRLHASDGSLLAEYAEQRRLFVPIDSIPLKLKEAYLAAEDKTFYQHAGLDWRGIFAAVIRYVQVKATGKGQIVGASTITQQVAKNFLLTNEQTLTRKLKEAMLVQRMEAAFTKDQIFELYLNEIFLGLNSYGVAAAALNYFGKSLDELSLDEMAYMAALPKGPNNYHPFRHEKRAIERRNWVLEQMYDNGNISRQEMLDAQAKPLKVNPRPFGAQMFAAESFAEEVRRDLVNIFGKEQLAKGGYSVRSTLDPKLQIMARQALARGLISFDRERGWRGPVKHVELTPGDWAPFMGTMKVAADLTPWQLAIVLDVQKEQATIGLQPGLADNGKPSDERTTATIPLELMKWAEKYVDGSKRGKAVTDASQVLAIGDIVYVAPSQNPQQFHLMQMPEVEGAMVAMDPHTGRVLAMVGGFSYGTSQFNRATQAMRQPGSSFKPIVYAAALDNGYTPASVVLDAPVEFRMSDGKIWRPKNYTGKFYGPSTLRRGIEQSRNAMTVRLAADLGMTRIADLAQRLGIYDRMPQHLANSLGSAETTLLRMTTAYSMFDNGGRKIEPTLIDRIQDRRGKTIWRHDKRDCSGCSVDTFSADLPDPDPLDNREQVMSPYTAYQITSMLEGVVERGTGQKLKAVMKPVAGKTGTSNDERDAWFVGYTPNLAVGAYIGFDNPKPMGKKRTGGELAAPIVADFMKQALEGKAAAPFHVPRAIELIPINAVNGKRGIFGQQNVILEAFKPGDEPPNTSRTIGEDGVAKQTASGEGVVLVPPNQPAQGGGGADPGLTPQGGGLY